MLGKLSLPQQHLEEPLVDYRDNWYHPVDNFTELELAYHSDRLAAISGLAAKFHGASHQSHLNNFRPKVISKFSDVRTIAKK
jgi:hypothetical protein